LLCISVGHAPLFKLGSVYKRIVDRFFSSYTPHQYISLDEGMIPWRTDPVAFTPS
jgi:hypothetical protein